MPIIQHFYIDKIRSGKSFIYLNSKALYKENIRERITAWFSEQGLTAQNQIVDFLKLQKGRFK